MTYDENVARGDDKDAEACKDADACKDAGDDGDIADGIDMTRVGRRAGKPKPDESKLGFGQYFTDHMFIMDYGTDTK